VGFEVTVIEGCGLDEEVLGFAFVLVLEDELLTEEFVFEDELLTEVFVFEDELLTEALEFVGVLEFTKWFCELPLVIFEEFSEELGSLLPITEDDGAETEILEELSPVLFGVFETTAKIVTAIIATTKQEAIIIKGLRSLGFKLIFIVILSLNLFYML
jgi:hypothetical protein